MGDLIKLFVTFAKMGLFTFGGGYAMLPMIKREIVEKNGWATEDEIMRSEERRVGKECRG